MDKGIYKEGGRKCGDLIQVLTLKTVCNWYGWLGMGKNNSGEDLPACLRGENET